MIYKRGMRGEEIKKIQELLGVKPVDGIFGVITEEAVKKYQARNNLDVDGVVGPPTYNKLFKHVYKKSCRKITELIVHCSATPEGRDYSVNDIRYWHRKRGFNDIGYHYVIYRDGTVALGRDVDLQGAHCARGGHNKNSIGICYIGGLENKPGIPTSKQAPKDTRTDAQKAALLSLLLDLKKLYPEAKVYGHHDFEPNKACPCFDAKKVYATV